MRLGIVTDIHLNPAGTQALAWHNPYHLADAAQRFEQALRQFVAARVDAVAVLGDLAHFGDAPSLRAGVELMAACGLPVWLVPGNHDVAQHPDRLDAALATVDAPNVHLAGVRGERVAGVRLAGLPALIGSPGWNARAADYPDTTLWGDDPVVWLTHYPMLSTEARTLQHGLLYAGDLENLGDVAAPLLQRAAPTVVLHGHLHVRDAVTAGALLQLGCAALIEPPFEVSILELTTGTGPPIIRRTSTALVAPPAVRLPVLVPADGSWAWTGGAWAAT